MLQYSGRQFPLFTMIMSGSYMYLCHWTIPAEKFGQVKISNLDLARALIDFFITEQFQQRSFGQVKISTPQKVTHQVHQWFVNK